MAYLSAILYFHLSTFERLNQAIMSMKPKFQFILFILFCAITLNANAQKVGRFAAIEVYRSSDLVITQISKNAYVHISFLQTDDFGYVPCNGVVLVNNNEALVFDTPTTDSVSLKLIYWIRDSLQASIKAIVPTHFHNDCLGGLKAFQELKIPSYANQKTIELATLNNFVVPSKGFEGAITLKLDKEPVRIQFFGEGHTVDNVVGYFPKEELLFGGCLIKELNATKGYLGDANISQWSTTVEKIKRTYPKLKVVVPGHGAYGDIKLLDYTISLFSPK